MIISLGNAVVGRCHSGKHCPVCFKLIFHQQKVDCSSEQTTTLAYECWLGQYSSRAMSLSASVATLPLDITSRQHVADCSSQQIRLLAISKLAWEVV